MKPVLIAVAAAAVAFASQAISQGTEGNMSCSAYAALDSDAQAQALAGMAPVAADKTGDVGTAPDEAVTKVGAVCSQNPQMSLADAVVQAGKK